MNKLKQIAMAGVLMFSAGAIADVTAYKIMKCGGYVKSYGEYGSYVRIKDSKVVIIKYGDGIGSIGNTFAGETSIGQYESNYTTFEVVDDWVGSDKGYVVRHNKHTNKTVFIWDDWLGDARIVSLDSCRITEKFGTL